jgi:2-polyprenyl-3-methyl-5-hydroxy-6-metoxy-1,4-benzoquinol methylase
VCGAKAKVFLEHLFDDRYGASGYYSIYRCKECGFGRTDPVLKKKDIGEFYKEHYPLSSLKIKDVKNSGKMLPRFLVWVMGVDNVAHGYITKGKDVLDVGSGSGTSLLQIKNKGANAYGVEPDPNAQKLAKRLKLNVHKGFITDNPFPKREFDYLTASQVLEHEPDPLKFLISARKKLRKNGRIILSFPNFDSIYRKIFVKNWLNWHVPYHINFFTKKSIEKLAKKANLRLVYCRTITPNIWTVLQIRKLFVKSSMGERNTLWVSKKSSTFTKLVNMFLFALSIPINRIIDILGLGDSTLVILENEK